MRRNFGIHKWMVGCVEGCVNKRFGKVQSLFVEAVSKPRRTSRINAVESIRFIAYIVTHEWKVQLPHREEIIKPKAS